MNTQNTSDWNPLWRAHQEYLDSIDSSKPTRDRNLHFFLRAFSLQFLSKIDKLRLKFTLSQGISSRRQEPISLDNLKTLRDFVLEILNTPLPLPPLFFVVRTAKWIWSNTKPSPEVLRQAERNRRPEYFDRRIKLTFHIEGTVAAAPKTGQRSICYIKIYIFGSTENYDNVDRNNTLERTLKTRMEFTQRAHEAQSAPPKALEICSPVETITPVENGSFKCMVLVNWLDDACDGYLNMHIEAIDNNGGNWTIGPDLSFSIYFKR
ncbi:hypothetical protein G9A89_005363 [Geosiphon pyriformis]|nr:hypothetical protein G9A89_005363 [Geosiphon pyriformis]